MLGSLNDSNTFFIDPPVAQSESDVLAGTYGGIGVSVSRDEAGNFVLFPFPDSPAYEAGLREADVIHAINGVEVDLSTQLDAVDQMLRGEVIEDNGVELTVRRGETLLTLFVKYSVINVPSVLWRTLDDERVGYIQVLRFTSRTPQELDAALKDLKASNVAAFILDLRNNSGGLLQESIQVADEFLDGGVVLHEITNNSETSFEVEAGGDAINQPLVVLINNRTASAAELVAGAIQDRGRGILIGQVTFGKGTIQQIFPLSDASSIHVTSAEWLTPNRNELDGVGLTPDIVMIPDESGRDIEIGEALQHIQDQLVTAEARGE
jgi:carboxyl-terminal processing protease